MLQAGGVIFHDVEGDRLTMQFCRLSMCLEIDVINVCLCVALYSTVLKTVVNEPQLPWRCEECGTLMLCEKINARLCRQSDCCFCIWRRCCTSWRELRGLECQRKGMRVKISNISCVTENLLRNTRVTSEPKHKTNSVAFSPQVNYTD
jgi:hypothetical protein